MCAGPPLVLPPLSLSLHSLRLILFLTPIQCSIAVVIASKCLNAFIVASSQLPRSVPPHPLFVWLPLSFSFFQVVVVAAAACPTCVVVIDLSLMGGSRCRLRLPQQREMWQREREGGGGLAGRGTLWNSRWCCCLCCCCNMRLAKKLLTFVCHNAASACSSSRHYKWQQRQ